MTSFFKGIRSGFFAVCIAIYTIVGATIVIILFTFFRRRKYLDTATRLWVRLILWTCRIRLTVEGLENLDKDSLYVYVANHQSHFDIPACIAVIPARLRMLAKKELFRIPIFGWSMLLVGHFRIDRENREKAIASLGHATERLKNEDISPVVYPEGTRSPDGKIHPFKRGAFVLAINSGRPVVPVTIVGSRSVLPKKSLVINPGHIRVFIDKPIPTGDYSFSDRNKLAQRVQKIIETRFNDESNDIPGVSKNTK